MIPAVALIALGCLVACSRVILPEQLVVTIRPNQGHVPYEATITCHTPGGQLTFELPDGTFVGPQTEHQFDVVVDSLNWKADVVWTDGEEVLTTTVTAIGNNPRPTIRGVRINGLGDLWQLEPLDRTLIEAIIEYSGEYQVVSFKVWGSWSSVPFTVFYPPYEEGVCHALWHSHVIDDACIVYPVYASIETEGLPYAPTGLEEGYPTSYRNTNQLYWDFPAGSNDELEIPPQDGFVRVTVLDDLGRRTSATFEIPIQGKDYNSTS